MIVSLICFILAAVCNAVINKLQFHYDSSIFPKDKARRQWWDPAISWKNNYMDYDVAVLYNNKPRLRKWWIFDRPVQLSDAFHFFKMWMVIFLAGACVSIAVSAIRFDDTWLNIVLLLIVYGVVWNCPFSLFFDVILKKRAK